MNEISVASQPSLKSVDNELLKKLFFYGGILLFANPPQITEFTIDFKTWQVGEKFKGLKFIPLGFHFISFQLIGSESTYLFWHFFNQNEVLVINWNTETEEFFKAQPEEIARYKYNIQEFDKFLGPYPLEESRSYEEFCALTSKLTAELLKNILPKSKDSDNKIVLNSFEVTSHLSKGNANVENNFLNFIHFDFKNFKKLKKHNLQSFRMQEHSDTDKIANISNSVNEKISSNLVGENLTNFYLDKSLLFENILMDFDKNRILGEFQFSFIIFVLGKCIDGFEQWKKLIILFLNCVECVSFHEEFFCDVLGILQVQLSSCPHDMFEQLLEDGNTNFLLNSLSTFVQLIYEKYQFLTKLSVSCNKIEKFCLQRFDWKLNEALECEEEDIFLNDGFGRCSIHYNNPA